MNHLFLLVISLLTLDCFRSIRFAHSHVISRLAEDSLNSFYYALSYADYDHLAWNDITTRKALSVIPEVLASQPLLLSIDDTMIEKF
jgi:hypothetical protein